MLFLLIWVLVACSLTCLGYMLHNELISGIGAAMVLITCAFEVV